MGPKKQPSEQFWAVEKFLALYDQIHDALKANREVQRRYRRLPNFIQGYMHGLLNELDRRARTIRDLRNDEREERERSNSLRTGERVSIGRRLEKQLSLFESELEAYEKKLADLQASLVDRGPTEVMDTDGGNPGTSARGRPASRSRSRSPNWDSSSSTGLDPNPKFDD